MRPEPCPEGCRFGLGLRLTRSWQRPDIDILISDESAEAVSSWTVAPASVPALGPTMHLAPATGGGDYSARLLLRGRELERVDQTQVAFPVTGGKPSRQETDVHAA